MPRVYPLPSYRLHKPTGLAVVRLSGRDVYLGKHGTEASRAEYERVTAEWLANGRTLPHQPAATPSSCSRSVNELILAYLEHAKSYYVKHGVPTGELPNIKEALKPVTLLYGDVDVTAFTPSALKAVREKMIAGKLCRNVINARVNRIRRMFKWGVENELVPASVLHALQAVSPLKRGRTEARETKPVQPVSDERIDAVVRVVSRQVAAMIELQRLTGMRPNEVTSMRLCDIDRSRPTWAYSPASHKTEHHGRSRVVFLGPKAQAILKPFLDVKPDSFIFSPAEAVEEHRASLRAKRKTPMTPSQAARQRKADPERAPGDRYTRRSYAYAVARGCDRAWPAPKGMDAKARKQWRREHRWSPNQLRHSAATALRREFGIEASRIVLGHSDAGTTLIYAAADENAAAEIMNQVG